ncbi:sensor histidine kinase [Kitasatospora sp. YST-16]|uniref:sensor histidine kinase n=1 Tax=Kitasatospora sp. YST-16 TaxID=2998080 RepID=UPI0022850CBB|nr:sensor histidine kinase [Kitasatospora sp. YST-16]WAL71492.1 sensor histidine kinase [Kitasatospora sp. YST-16]WNW37532.1 sensor histidine kinase [Streptomyces sp. Li-HN-5-13]
MGRPQQHPDTAAAPDGAPWTHTDALVAVAAGLFDALGALLFAALDGNRGPGLPGFLLALLAALPLLFRRDRPVPAFAAVLALGVAADLARSGAPHFGAVLVVALYSVARASTFATTAAAALAASVTTVLGQSHFRTPTLAAVLSAPCSALLVAGAGLAVARWQREVTANRQLLADRAVAEERRRIARELHDVVAHHITTMQLMAGGARANLADPEVVRDALVTLESSGRLALREMRQLLDVLRAGDEPDAVPPAPQPGTDDLPRLLEESRRAGLPADLTVHGEVRPLPPALGLAVFRIVQEALTNTRKHAGPTRATVRLTYAPDLLTVHVRDHGPGAGAGPGSGFARSSTEPSGHGLIGMRERAALHGGTLTATPHPDGGFAVHAELPLPAEELTDESDELPPPVGDPASPSPSTEPPSLAGEFASRPAEPARAARPDREFAEPTSAEPVFAIRESAVLPAEARR